ncbi:arginine transporter Can1, partial [Kluyveromyces marxianus]
MLKFAKVRFYISTEVSIYFPVLKNKFFKFKNWRNKHFNGKGLRRSKSLVVLSQFVSVPIMDDSHDEVSIASQFYSALQSYQIELEELEALHSSLSQANTRSHVNITHSKSADTIGYSKENNIALDTIDDDSSHILDPESAVGNAEVKRALKPRHISMIALGGTIGTGLFVSIAGPLWNAGPVGSLISFMFIGTLAYSVTQSLGEMATFIPVTSSFTVFSQRFLSPAIGAANGYMYWFSWAITFALELSIVGQIIQYWTHAVPLEAWIAIFWVILVTFNMFPVKWYGEFEFWVASVKVLAIIGFLIYSLCMVCGAGKGGAIGFRYWRNPGPWGNGMIAKDLNEKRFLGWVSSLISAAFTYQGTELVGITAGESKNPRKAVPRAINK